jgi:hypothetical protein
MVYQLLIFTLQNNCCEKYSLNDIDTTLTFYKTKEQLFDTLVNEFRSELESFDNNKTYRFLQFIVDNKYVSKNRNCACGKLYIISTKTEDTNISHNRLIQLIDESQISILLDDFQYGSFSTQLNNNSNNNNEEVMEPSNKKRRTAFF